MKRLISVLVSITLLFSSLMPLSAYASVRTQTVDVPLLQDGSYDEVQMLAESSQLAASYSNLDELKDFIYQSLLNEKANFDIHSYKIQTSDFVLIYTGVVNDNPDLFYVSSSIGYYYYNDGTVGTVCPKYVVESSEIEKAKAIYHKGINYALDLVDDSMDDVQKALVIHDYICMSSLYPKLSTNADDKEIYHSAYGVFYNGRVVCAGYALAYSALMNALGIPCKYVISNSMAHAWNVIQINGKWYNVDLTYDDLYMSLGENAYSVIAHSCFLKSTAAMTGNTGVWHRDISYPDGITCDDTTYDNAFWNDINTNIPVINGEYYYIDCNKSTLRYNLIKRDKKGNSSLVSQTTYRTAGQAKAVSNPNNTSEKHYYYIYYSPLINFNRRLYFSNVNYASSSVKTGSLNAINYDGSDEKVFVTLNDNQCFLSVGVENGDLLYVPVENMARASAVSVSRMAAFDDSFNSGSYDPYADANNDGVNNAKDYAMILNEKY